MSMAKALANERAKKRAATSAPKKKNGKPKTETGSAAEWFPIAKLVGWKDNPRVNEKAIPAVAESIYRFGFGAPIVARLANREIIAGHTRVAAAHTLDMGSVPVRFLDLSARASHALAVIDNKSNELAGWNEDGLSKVLAGLSKEFDFAKMGFDETDLKLLLEGPKFAPSGEPQGKLDIQASIVCPHCGKSFKRSAK